MAEEVRVFIEEGEVRIVIPAERMFSLLRYSGLTWTENWWERNVSLVVWDAMAEAIAKGAGEAKGGAI